jgi:uncharacterized membrane protein YhaH (DUF805 family)
MQYYLKALHNYANFNGRSNRQDYWMFFLFNVIFAIVAMILDRLLGTTFKMEGIYGGAQTMPYGYIYLAYALFMLIPGLAIGVRRLHDVGKSGWFMFICLIPLIGAIWLLVLFCTEGKRGDNEYGPDPNAGATDRQFVNTSDNL